MFLSGVFPLLACYVCGRDKHEYYLRTCTALHYTNLQYTALYFSILHNIKLHYTALQMVVWLWREEKQGRLSRGQNRRTEVCPLSGCSAPSPRSAPSLAAPPPLPAIVPISHLELSAKSPPLETQAGPGLVFGTLSDNMLKRNKNQPL